ncbi:MAG: recombination-associated protein RdgC [Deltaproteobacteria bacterium]|nr:recombination-associated protein RdgC [Deltaproteobacteria bacterium]
MPIRKGSVTFVRFRVKSGPKEKRALSTGLRKKAFEPIDRASDQDRAQGWVELEDSESAELTPTSFLFGERLLVSWRVDKLVVPRRLLASEVDKWRAEFAEREERPPSRGETREQKAIIHQELRGRAFVKTETYDVSWELVADELWVWATSNKVIDEILEALEAMAVVLVPTSPGARAEGIDPKKLEPTEALHHLTRAES